jgi:spore coat polysaccharide biosynthesis protein SpsF (cytidylyltransferase family)
MRTAIFIPVRVKSTRLPKKPLLRIKGKTVIEHLIQRVKLAKLPRLIVLCTTTSSDDAILVDIAKKHDVEYFRGSEKDILNRYLNAALKYGLDFVVNVDGDDVFCDPDLIDKTIEAYVKTGADFIKWGGLPFGASPCGIKVKALKKVCKIKDETDTETGWSRYFTNTGIFRVHTLKSKDKELNRPDVRMTLDYPEDFKFVKGIFDRLYSPGKIFTLKYIMKLLKKEPKLAEINRSVQKAYWERFEKRAKIKLKK